MARITVEDCLNHVDNRFDLVLLASRRARQLAHGAASTLPWENDKPTVMALREIATGKVSNKMVDDAQKKLDEAAAAAALNPVGFVFDEIEGEAPPRATRE